MEKIINRLTELIEKDRLSEAEKTELDSILTEHEEARKFYDTYNKIKSASGKSAHISSDDLGRYILFKNNDGTQSDDFRNRITEIENHLKNCLACQAEYEMLSEEYSFASEFVAGQLYQEKKTISAANMFNMFTKQSYAFKYSFAAVFVLGFLYIILNAASFALTPLNYKLAFEMNNKDVYVTRGRATTEFQKGLKAIENDDYQDAIIHFKNDIELAGNENTLFYTYYILGLTDLEAAQKEFIGLFPNFNTKLVNDAIFNLNKSLELNNGTFKNIELDTYFYLGKAYLILGNIEMAKMNLNKVVSEKGSKMNNAKEVLSELE